ncbi:hypothetical protein ACLOJK_036000 [Asimina triloba]
MGYVGAEMVKGTTESLRGMDEGTMESFQTMIPFHFLAVYYIDASDGKIGDLGLKGYSGPVPPLIEISYVFLRNSVWLLSAVAASWMLAFEVPAIGGS